MQSPQSPIILLGRSDSAFLADLADRLGPRARRLDQDAVFQGGAVTVDRDGVVWQGVSWPQGTLVFVERSVYAWPQPVRTIESATTSDAGQDGDAYAAAAAREREARALTLSALRIAALRGRVVNPPNTAWLAAAPVTCLDRLGRSGVAVAENGEPGTEVLDALVVLVIGGRIAATLPPTPDTEALDARLVDLAVTAAARLELDLAAVTLASAAPAVLAVDAGPDLDEWNRVSKGRVAETCAAFLTSLTPELAPA